LRKNSQAAIGFALLLFATLTDCAHASRHPHWLRIADGAGDVASLNPHLTMGATTDHLAQLTMAHLVRFGPGGKPVPELATEIPSPSNGGVSRDGLRITWHLRRGVRWSDGAPFDARDVVFSTRAILNTSNNEALGTEGWDAIASIATPDPYTVVYTLKRPYGALVAMSFVTVGGGPCLLPAHILGRLPTINRAPYNAKPVGIGPFRITAWKRGDAVEMEANPYYFRGRPKLDRITFKLISSREALLAQMRAGDVDLWPLAPPTYLPQLATIPGLHTDDTAMLRTTHLDFFLPHVPDVRVRRAIRLAIDRPHLVRTVEHGFGLVSDHIVWPRKTVVRDDPQAIPYSPSRARALLEAAGWHLAGDGIRIREGQRLSLAVAYQSGAPDLDRLIEVVRDELHAVGVEIVTHPYAHGLLFAQPSDGGILARGRFDLALYSSTITSVPDLASGVSCATVPPVGENFSHYCEPAIDALTAQMRATSDPATVDRLFNELDRRFIDDAPSIQLFVWKGGNAASDAMRGYRSNALTSFDEMMQTDI
jgi:peptide/nickel transport system substrate-binding protein